MHFLTVQDSRTVEGMVELEGRRVEVPAPTNQANRRRSTMLYAFPGSHLIDQALRLIQVGPASSSRNGFEGWRIVSSEYAPRLANRKLAMLMAILAPQM